nr:FecR family protein [Mucilaginibacter sp. L294]
MQNLNIKDLLAKYKTGTISADEMILLETWYLQWDPEKQELADAELLAIKDEVWQSVAPRKQVTFKRAWPRIAAAAALLLFVSVSAYYLLHKTAPVKPTAIAQIQKPDFKPGGNKAILTLADGKQIWLKDATNGKLAEQGAVVINKTAEGKVIYDALAGNTIAAASAFNTMSTPRGGQYQLTLADGTKVWLNAASSITFPVVFSKNERKVRVNGEAYFEVAHDAGKPFIVATGNQEITVLGTHFNVKAYDDDAGISTTLLAGSIRIKNLTSGKADLLTPGQQAKIYRDKNDINIKTVNTDDVISWKNGYFLFDNQEIKSIMKIMSRWYDVDIEYKNTNKQDRFGGTFSRSSNMSEILNNLERIGNIHFKMEAKKVIVLD